MTRRESYKTDTGEGWCNDEVDFTGRISFQNVHFPPHPIPDASGVGERVLRNTSDVTRNTTTHTTLSKRSKGGAEAVLNNKATANRTAADGRVYGAASNKATAPAEHSGVVSPSSAVVR